MEIGQTQGRGGFGAQPSAPSSELGKEQFLQLLTTQMTNQDPLDPMDNEAFVAQLAQFSSLEQMINIGSSVQDLALAQATANGANMATFIGREVTFIGNSVHVDGAQDYDLAIDLQGDASEVTVSVYDAEGNLVKTLEGGAMEEGNGAITWDGTDEQGRPVKQGDYSYKVSAKDDEGNSVSVSTRQTGRVEGVTYESGYPELVINGQRVPVGQIIQVLEVGTQGQTASADNSDQAGNDQAKNDKRGGYIGSKGRGIDRF